MAVDVDTSRRRATPDAGDAMLDLQRRYLEAWREAGQIMLDAMQTVARRQAELAEEGVREFWADSAEAARGMPDPQRGADRLDRVQALYQRAFGGFQELSEILLRAQSEAVRKLVDGVAAGGDASRRAA